MVYCPNCGAENPDENEFCGKCGTKLAKLEAQKKKPPAEKPRKKKVSKPTPTDKNKIYAGIGIAIVVIGIIGAYSIFSGGEEERGSRFSNAILLTGSTSVVFPDASNSGIIYKFQLPEGQRAIVRIEQGGTLVEAIGVFSLYNPEAINVDVDVNQKPYQFNTEAKPYLMGYGPIAVATGSSDYYYVVVWDEGYTLSVEYRTATPALTGGNFGSAIQAYDGVSVSGSVAKDESIFYKFYVSAPDDLSVDTGTVRHPECDVSDDVFFIFYDSNQSQVYSKFVEEDSYGFWLSTGETGHISYIEIWGYNAASYTVAFSSGQLH